MIIIFNNFLHRIRKEFLIQLLSDAHFSCHKKQDLLVSIQQEENSYFKKFSIDKFLKKYEYFNVKKLYSKLNEALFSFFLLMLNLCGIFTVHLLKLPFDQKLIISLSVAQSRSGNGR